MANGDLDRSAFILKCAAILMGFVSIGTIVCGILTVVYAAPHFQWPYASCSGIWAGIVALVAAVFGIVGFMRFDSSQPRATKCQVCAFYGLMISCISTSIQHLVYSAQGLANCASRDDRCNPEERDNLILTESFSVVFGAIICIVSIAAMIYMATKARIQNLAGVPESKRHECCGGLC